MCSTPDGVNEIRTSGAPSNSAELPAFFKGGHDTADLLAHYAHHWLHLICPQTLANFRFRSGRATAFSMLGLPQGLSSVTRS
jgi:hypothetical protein